MPKKEKPVPPQIDWVEFVEAMRLRELSRRFNRPSQMLERHRAVEWDSGRARVRYYRDVITGKITPSCKS